MDKEKVAKAFNEWMRRYTETPEQFERDWQAVLAFQLDKACGREPTYGETCAAFLAELMA